MFYSIMKKNNSLESQAQCAVISSALIISYRVLVVVVLWSSDYLEITYDTIISSPESSEMLGITQGQDVISGPSIRK